MIEKKLLEIKKRHYLQSSWPQVMMSDMDYPGARRVAAAAHEDRGALLEEIYRLQNILSIHVRNKKRDE